MKMRFRSAPILAGIALTLLAGVLRARADERPIRAYGASTLAELIQGVGTEFMKEHPDVRVKVLARTSEFGIRALLNGEADLVMASRKPNVVERRLAERKGIKWAGVRVAWENIAVISHPGISVRELTVDRLRKIYAGDYKNWRDVGGPDLPILPHSLAYPQDDIALWFADHVLSRADFAWSTIWVGTPDFLVQHVSVHPGAVAYLGYRQLSGALERRPQAKVRVVGVRENAKSPAFAPSSEISKKGPYPLTIPLFLFWNENDPDSRIGQFARFCQAKLQEPAKTK